MSPRRYDLGRRGEAGRATRAKILEATRLLLSGRGDFADFSMDSIAVKAGVSRMTVYNQFRSRGGLLDALADDLAGRGGMQRMRSVFMEPDPGRALGTFVSTFVGFWSSERVLLRRMRAMGVIVPEVYRGVRERDSWRYEAAENLLKKIGGSARRAGGVAREDRVALLAALTSFETFDTLCTDSRTPEMVAALLTESLVELLGVPKPATGAKPPGGSTG